MSALRNQTEPLDILRELARATWAKVHNAAACPPARIPTPTDLSGWDWPADVRAAIASWLTDRAGPDPLTFEAVGVGDSGSNRPLPSVDAAVLRRALETAALDRLHLVTRNGPLPLSAALAAAEAAGMVRLAATDLALLIGTVHHLWLTLSKPRPRHPLAALVDAWQRSTSVDVAPDRHNSGILPAALRDARRNHAMLPLELDHDTPLGPIGVPDQGYLPGLEQPPSRVPPVPWLTLYDLTGVGPVQTRGRGAPLAQRLFVEVLTAVLIGDRATAWSTAPPITLRNLFEWCWPRYYDHNANRVRGGHDRSKHLSPLRRALVELDNMRIMYDGWERRLIRVDDLPTAATALDEPVRFHVRHLPGSDRGPMITRATARRWGVVSAPAWRATIRLAYLWDEAKARNHGARVYATRPAVARGADGVILGANGKPLRDRRHAVVKDWSDPRAVILGANGKPAGDGNPPAQVRNPAADRVTVLGPDDLIRLAFDDNITRSNRRERLRLAREALAAKEAASEIVRELEGCGGERIIETRR